MARGLEPENYPMTKQNASDTSRKKSMATPPKAAPAKKASAAGTPPKARARTAPTANVAPANVTPAQIPARPGGKLGLIVDRLGTEAGATIEELASMTGWQMHTVHAALSRLRKRGFAMKLDRDGERKAYRLDGLEG